MEIDLSSLAVLGTAVASVAGTLAVLELKAKFQDKSTSSLEKALSDEVNKRTTAMAEIFQRLNAVEQTRPTHDDLKEINDTVNKIEGRVRNTETGVATMGVELKNIEKSISRVSHTSVSTNALVQLLVLNSTTLSTREKTEFLNNTHTGAEK